MRVILASGSPRRREILARLVYPFEARGADLDEARRPGEAARDYVARLAVEKAQAVARTAPEALVIGADTAVVVEQEVLGKPTGPSDAKRMLGLLSGRRHQVMSGVAMVQGDRVREVFVSSTDVELRRLTTAEIERYVSSGEPLDKAGAYAIQGGAGEFVRGVRGSPTGVIGLPLDETRAALRRLGVPEPSGRLTPEAIGLRFRAVRGEIAARAVAAGRRANSVRLVTVTKGHPAAVAAAAVAAGASDLGENYVQEAVAKRAQLDLGGAKWHLIGPLQRNKAGLAAATFDVIHTVDRVDTARALGRRVPAGVHALEVLAQVNVARDPAKSGVAPDALPELLRRVSEIAGIRVCGLMTIGALGGDSTATFAELRELRDRLRAEGHDGLRELSMGMSDDYDVAIEQGATLVRVGTAIVGPRPPRREAQRP